PETLPTVRICPGSLDFASLVAHQLLPPLFLSTIPPPPSPTLFPYTTLFRSRPPKLRTMAFGPSPRIRSRLACHPNLRNRMTGQPDRKSTRLNSSHLVSRMPSSA